MNNEEEGKRRKILSNIPTVSGTRAARAQEAAEADEDIKKRQMMIAREMAREDFEKALPYLRRNELTDTRIRSDAEFAADSLSRNFSPLSLSLPRAHSYLLWHGARWHTPLPLPLRPTPIPTPRSPRPGTSAGAWRNL